MHSESRKKDGAMSSLAAVKVLDSHRRNPPPKRIKIPSRRISCHDLGAGECEGWLMRKEEHKIIKSSWKKRWVVLKEDYVLYIFKQKSDERALTLICLPGYQIKEEPKIKQYFPFRICHPKISKNFLFASERKEDLVKWVEKLSLATLAETEWPALGGSCPITDGDTEEVPHFSESEEETDSPQGTPKKEAPTENRASLESISSSASNDHSPAKGNSSDSSHSSLQIPSKDQDNSSFDGSFHSSMDNLNTAEERSGNFPGTDAAAESIDDLLKLYGSIQDSQVQIVGPQKSGPDFKERLKRANSIHLDPTSRSIFRKKALELTLKDKEESLEAITKLLSTKDITSETLREWADSHPYLIQSDSPYNTLRKKRKEEKTMRVDEQGRDTSSSSRSSSSSEECKTPTHEDTLDQPQPKTEPTQPNYAGEDALDRPDLETEPTQPDHDSEDTIYCPEPETELTQPNNDSDHTLNQPHPETEPTQLDHDSEDRIESTYL